MSVCPLVSNFKSCGVKPIFCHCLKKKVVNLGDPGWWQNGRPGCGAWGGADGTVIFCAGVALYMIEVGTIEETFLHEGAHVNHDSNLYHTEKWKCARDSDKHYISNYAKDYPLRYRLVLSFIHLM